MMEKRAELYAGKAKSVYATDEAALVEHLGHPVSIIKGDYRNIKITTVEDLEMAKMFIKYGASR